MNELDGITQKVDVLNHVPIGMFLIRKDYSVIFWNKCLENWTGVGSKDIIGKNLGDNYSHFKTPAYYARLGIIFQGGPPAIFSSQLHKHIIPSPLPNGSFRIQHTTVTSVPSIDGKSYYALFAIEDVSDISRRIQAIKEAEKTKIEKEKLKGVIETAGAVCHELNQPLMIISALSEIIMNQISEGDSMYKNINNIFKAVKRAGATTQKLANITRYETRAYVSGSKIIDIDKASEASSIVPQE
ncbi:hypothetical protein QUF90_12930 [Desulfococcaceae bacterium HSG9]|nr:hypothetical protein [Desulfococcaceae bacterium HSG9]